MDSQSKKLLISAEKPSSDNRIIPEAADDQPKSKRESQKPLSEYFHVVPGSSSRKKEGSGYQSRPGRKSSARASGRPIPIEAIEGGEEQASKEKPRRKTNTKRDIEAEAARDEERLNVLKMIPENTVDRYFHITEMTNQIADPEKALKLVAMLKTRERSERKLSLGTNDQSNKLDVYFPGSKKKAETARKSVLKKKLPESSLQKKNTKKIMIQTPEKHQHSDDLSDIRDASIRAKKASSYKRGSGAFCFTYEIIKAPTELENETGKKHIITPVKHSRRLIESKHIHNSIDQQILEKGDYVFLPNNYEELDPMDDKTKRLKSILHRKATPYKSGKQIDEEPEIKDEDNNIKEESHNLARLEDKVIHKVVDPNFNNSNNYAIVSLSKKGERKYGSKTAISPLKKFSSTEGKQAKEDLKSAQKKYGEDLSYLPLNQDVLERAQKMSRHKE